MSTFLDGLKDPEYTGANRCPPCTAVNVVLAVLVSMVIAVVWFPLGVLAFVASLASIYFRGYLVPGTPELTKRYFPDWLLAKFDKLDEPPVGGAGGVTGAGGGTGAGGAAGGPGSTNAQAAAAAKGDAAAVEQAREAAEAEGIVDPETLLLEAGVVEECADGADLCLTDVFETAWAASVETLRGDVEAQRAAVADLFDRDSVLFTKDKHGRWVGSDGSEKLNTWVSEGAATADLAAAGAIAERADWAAVLPEQRVAILKALRSFYDTCALCGGAMEMTEDTVDSCCRSWEVLAVRCTACEEHFLEIDPETLSASGGGATGAAGDRDVDPGFTQG